MTGKRLKILRCDNGKEYLNNRIYKFARDKGIRINNCPTYVHELNGTTERYNRTVMDMARCLLAEAKVHKMAGNRLDSGILEESNTGKYYREKDTF